MKVIGCKEVFYMIAFIVVVMIFSLILNVALFRFLWYSNKKDIIRKNEIAILQEMIVYLKNRDNINRGG